MAIPTNKAKEMIGFSGKGKVCKRCIFSVGVTRKCVVLSALAEKDVTTQKTSTCEWWSDNEDDLVNIKKKLEETFC